jgi:hypothetical protein
VKVPQSLADQMKDRMEEEMKYWGVVED